MEWKGGSCLPYSVTKHQQSVILDIFLTFSGIPRWYASNCAGHEQAHRREEMNDLLYVLLTAVFFLLTFAVLRLCDYLMGGTK
jgi:hypothetical protein